jgi:hypothetical protein
MPRVGALGIFEEMGTGLVFCDSLKIETYIFNVSKKATTFIIIGIANYPLLKRIHGNIFHPILKNVG